MKALKNTILVILCLSLNSCFIGKAATVSKAKKEFTVENYAIPPEFGNDENSYLIGVLHGPDYYDKFVRNKFEKAYTGKYILLTEEELDSEKYQDLEQFRYTLAYTAGSSQTHNVTVTQKKFFVYDRLNKKKYITGAEFPYYAKAMEVYISQLDKKLNE